MTGKKVTKEEMDFAVEEITTAFNKLEEENNKLEEENQRLRIGITYALRGDEQSCRSIVDSIYYQVEDVWIRKQDVVDAFNEMRKSLGIDKSSELIKIVEGI